MNNQNTYALSQWRERVNQKERIKLNTTSMRADVKANYGNSVQDVKALELENSTQ